MSDPKEYSLSDDDIRQLLGGNIKITSYPDLDRVENINDLFDSKGRAIIFIPQQDTHSGHWTAMIKDGKHIEFFDPYGESPDDQTDGISNQKLEQMRMKEPLLADLLEETPYKVIFNKMQLQELADDVQTCGRHCVCRLIHYKQPLSKYREIIRKSGDSPDEFVVKHTIQNLGK
jgi:hypothetical protein